MASKQYRAVILDMDGVVTDSAKVHARAWKQAFDEFLRARDKVDDGEQPPFDIHSDYRLYVDGKPRYEGVQSFLESREIELPRGSASDPPGIETVCGVGNRKNELFRELLDTKGVKVYEDAVAQIRQWKERGVRVGLVTSSRNCGAVLDSAGLSGAFEVVVDGIDLDRMGLRGKPSPDMYAYAASLLGVPPAETVVIEDAIAGVQAGSAGGFGMVIGVARNDDGEKLKEAGADRVVATLNHVPESMEERVEAPAPASAAESALDRWPAVAERLAGRHLALFLDYDGTLTPIVRRPEDARLSPEMRTLLEELAPLCTVAVVSGRDRKDVAAMVGIDGLAYAGSHGFDIRRGEDLAMEHEDAQNALGDLDAAEKQLKERIEAITGAWVERKRFAIAVHFREVENDDGIGKIEQAVDAVVGTYTSLRKRGGKKIFELQPDVDWDKGRAVLWLAEALGLRNGNALIMYIGDDETDEDAFEALRREDAGIGVRVAAESESTAAHYYLRDCAEVAELFHRILKDLRPTGT